MRDEAAHTLVTGGSGFIGGALIRRLLDRGEPVVAIERDTRLEADPRLVRAQGDIGDFAFCRRVLADYRVDRIYHLASQSIVQTCADDPVGALSTNVMGTATLLEAARAVGLSPRVVVSTSDKVYGAAPSPYVEETPLDARNAYEVSKACQDLVSRLYFHNYGLDVRVVRAVNIYGPGDPNETRLIPRTVQRCLRGQPPVVHEGAGEMLRSFLYVEDMVTALQVVMGPEGLGGEAFCVGSPDHLNVREVIAEICRQTGTPFDHVTGQRRDGFREIADQSIDDTKLRGLGWSPKVNFTTGIAKTVDWYRRR